MKNTAADMQCSTTGAVTRVLVVMNLAKEDAESLGAEIDRLLTRDGIEVELFGFKGKPDREPPTDVDLVISLGGDGTVLYCCRRFGQRQIPVLPVNLGAFGFITEVTKTEWWDAFQAYRSGAVGMSRRLMLLATWLRGERELGRFVGLNDAVIAASGASKVLHLCASSGGTALGSYQADGMIVATPTGSTAYSAAAGGPILHPELDALLLNPICPFTLSHRPLVIPGDEVVDIQLDAYQRTEIVLTIDGQLTEKLLPGDTVRVRRADTQALIIRSHLRSFYEVLRLKLGWAGSPEA